MLDIATQNESLDVMEILLKHVLNVNRVNGWKKTPLLIAIECNNPAAMKLLIAYGADVELRTAYTPLVCTASKDQEVSRMLVENGAKIPTEDGLQCEMLLEAVRHENRYLVDLIFEGDIDIRHDGEAHAATGREALRAAITKHRYELFHLLLEKGADPTYPASGGDNYSPLWMTIQIKARDNLSTWAKEMVRNLLEKGCNPNEQETNHWTPLAMAVESQDYDIVKMLLEEGVDPNIGSFLHDTTNSPSKCTPLAQALRKRNETVAQLLIHHGAGPKIQPRRDQYLLVKAVSLGMPRCCIEKMLQMGVNVNSKSPSEETALFLAVMEGDEYLTKTLLNYGANPNSTKQSLSVLSWALRKKHLGVAKILRERGAMEFAE